MSNHRTKLGTTTSYNGPIHQSRTTEEDEDGCLNAISHIFGAIVLFFALAATAITISL